jgi:hypothetical protein
MPRTNWEQRDASWCAAIKDTSPPSPQRTRRFQTSNKTFLSACDACARGQSQPASLRACCFNALVSSFAPRVLELFLLSPQRSSQLAMIIDQPHRLAPPTPDKTRNCK